MCPASIAGFTRQPIRCPRGPGTRGDEDFDGVPLASAEGFDEDSTFIARFIFGFDLWFTDPIGSFIEGGYHVAEDEDIDGMGIFTFGAQYRFPR